MDNRMTFRSGTFDISPKEAKRMYAALNDIVQYWDGMDPAKIPSRTIEYAAHVVKVFQERTRNLPGDLPREFILVHAPKPTGGDFDDWMQQHREILPFDNKTMHTFLYADYSAHPIRHLRDWAARQQQGRGCYAYFVPHRKATQRYAYRKNASEDLPPFAMHYNFAFPMFQTLDLTELQVARGPYAGRNMTEVFHEGPGTYLVKRVWFSNGVVQKYLHRRTIVYATWVAHLAPPYGTWRGHVR